MKYADKLIVLSEGKIISDDAPENVFNYKKDIIPELSVPFSTKLYRKLAKNNMKNVVGFITQKRITCEDLVCMTPGISNSVTQEGDQQYRQITDVDTDFIIVGRALYNSSNVMQTLEKYVTIITNCD